MFFSKIRKGGIDLKTGALICEYNPLHNGHIYQIQQTRNAGITHLTAILSDDFVQRGDTAVLNKFQRAELALKAGIDLVIELPMPYSCASAECYARGAVQMINALQCIQVLSFGCSGELEKLQTLAGILTKLENAPALQKYLKAGNSYPSAVFAVISENYPAYQNLLSDSNNLLALEYLKAIQKLNASVQPLGIQRKGVLHDSQEVSGCFASASLIRKKLQLHESFQAFVPDFTEQLLHSADTANFSNLEQIILYQIRMLEDFEKFPDVTPDLAGRFLKARQENSLESLLEHVKSKNFTMARIKRILLYMLTGIQKQDLHTEIPYVRILGFNRNGTELLKRIRQESKIPVDTSLAKLRKTSPQAEHFAQIQERSASLYGLAKKYYSSAEQEFRSKIKLYHEGEILC